MAQIPYRANLSSATYAMSYEKAGRTIINPGTDQNFDRRVDPPGDTSKASVGIPQIIFMENVLPTYEGYQSIGYKPVQSIALDASNTVNHILKLTVQDGTNTSPDEYTLKIQYDSEDIAYSIGYLGTENIVNVPGFGVSLNPAFAPLSAVYVQGRSFLYDGASVWEVTNPAGTLVFTDVTGTIVGLGSLIIKFVSAFNYLIAIDITGLTSWSSLTNPLDFTVSLVTGAGFTNPTGIRSPVVTMLEHPQGFIIYTKENAVAARYTGNRAYPWRFYEIESSGGINRHYDVTGGTNSAAHFARTAAGNIVSLTMDGSEIILPDISDYLQTSRFYTIWDYSTSQVVISPYPAEAYEFDSATPSEHAQLATRIIALNDRYLCISVGRAISATGQPVSSAQAAIFDFVIIYDYLLKRTGKFRITHTHMDAAAGNLYAVAGYDSALYSVDSNMVWRVYHDIMVQEAPGESEATFHRGVLILGKLQYVRNYNLVLEGLEIEITQPEPEFIIDSPDDNTLYNFEVLDFQSYDGFNLQPGVELFLQARTTYLVKFLTHLEARNHVLSFAGAFSMSSILCNFSIGGKPS